MKTDKSITLKNIAENLNVSISTVSKALNNSYEISAVTKDKIRLYAKKNNYQPYGSKINFRNRKTKIIGVIIPDIKNHVFTDVINTIEKIANKKGLNLIICTSDDSFSNEKSKIKMLINGTVDGIIVSIAQETQKKENYSHFKNVIKQGIPIVMFDRVSTEIQCDKIIVDDLQAAYNATSHFIKTGCSQIAILSTINYTSVERLRIRGYLKAMNENSMSVDKDLIISISKKQDFERSLRNVLVIKKIDAVLCLDELSAVKTLKIINKLGYKTPEDISVIGFTDGELLRNVNPTISAIDQHGEDIGKIAMEFMTEKLEEDSPKGKPFNLKIINTSFIERQTTHRLKEAYKF